MTVYNSAHVLCLYCHETVLCLSCVLSQKGGGGQVSSKLVEGAIKYVQVKHNLTEIIVVSAWNFAQC